MKKIAVTVTLMMMIFALVGCASEGEFIGTDRAKSIALENAGVTESDVVGLEIDLERETDSGAIYDVSFDTEGYDYKYEINAQTGDIIRQKKEIDDDLPSSNPEDENKTSQNVSEPVSAETSSDASENSSVNSVPESNTVSETASSSSASSAAVPSSSVSSSSTASSANTEYIGREKAKDIALNHAGYGKSQVSDLECELEHEYGTVVYDVSFDADNYEYEYKINAVTGNIIDSDKTWDNDLKPDPSLNLAEYIGSETAKSIALENAGLSSANVRDFEVELDQRLNSVVYEVSFDADYYEYEYEIDAYSGKILYSQKKRD